MTSNVPKFFGVLISCIVLSSIILAFIPIILGGFTDISGTGILLSTLFVTVLLIVFSAAIFIFLKNVMTNG